MVVLVYSMLVLYTRTLAKQFAKMNSPIFSNFANAFFWDAFAKEI